MPIYEFDCGACGERFEALVDVGTESAECKHCGSPDTHRVMSAPGALWKFAKSPGAARQQEARNAKLNADAKARFKKTMSEVRAAKKGGGPKP